MVVLKKRNDKKCDKKYRNCSLPFLFCDKKKNTTYWLSFDKRRKEFYLSQYLSYSLEDLAKAGLSYHYQANIYCLGNKRERPNYRIKVSHCHCFEEVIHALYKHPDTFVIPKEYLKEYSEQELRYLKLVQNFFHIIGLKDEKRSKELMEVTAKVDELYSQKRTLKNRLELNKYYKLESKIYEKEKIQRCNNTKATLFLNYRNMHIDNERIIESILKEERDYRIYRKHFKNRSRVGERHFLIDKDENYRAILEFVSEEEIKFKDLTENMVDYKSSGFKHFQDFKKDLEQKFLEESKWYKESFNENSTISYVKFRILEIIENNRIR